ncbi:hypothetical protein MAL08_02970 [Leptospira noguchii]|uniref:hypothetical protein n=1 Tax=Leptospira noguchii TaxID=28182 RepID=UPI001FB736BE|nr:hypothetical protein [Leptospira noguchii]UOG38319.1 hypothetical protein MAL08_02970 [Leptospira noguchii]
MQCSYKLNYIWQFAKFRVVPTFYETKSNTSLWIGVKLKPSRFYWRSGTQRLASIGARETQRLASIGARETQRLASIGARQDLGQVLNFLDKIWNFSRTLINPYRLTTTTRPN